MLFSLSVSYASVKLPVRQAVHAELERVIWMCAASHAKQNADVSPVLVSAAIDLSSDIPLEVFTGAAF